MNCKCPTPLLKPSTEYRLHISKNEVHVFRYRSIGVTFWHHLTSVNNEFCIQLDLPFWLQTRAMKDGIKSGIAQICQWFLASDVHLFFVFFWHLQLALSSVFLSVLEKWETSEMGYKNRLLPLCCCFALFSFFCFSWVLVPGVEKLFFRGNDDLCHLPLKSRLWFPFIFLFSFLTMNTK